MFETSRFDTRTALRLFGVFCAVALLWQTPVVAPLKIFVVLLHEISHGAAAVLSGGSIDRIEINANQGGVCYTLGGNRFAILSAGYLGSMLWGGVIMLLAARTRLDQALSAVIGLGVLLLALFYVRSLFGFIFCGAFSLAMLVAAFRFSHDTNELILKTIGMTSTLYAPLDIFDDVIARSGIGSDAEKLASLTLVPSFAWGTLWIALSVAAAIGFLFFAVRRSGAQASAG